LGIWALHIVASFLVAMWIAAPRLGVAATYHVSPKGSNTPPYDTYAKAAHSIQDAIDQAMPLDTVRIGAGVYRPDTTILLEDSVVVLGAGTDSTVIFPQHQYSLAISLKRDRDGGGFEFHRCTVRGYGTPPLHSTPRQTGLFTSLVPAKCVVSGNSFRFCRIAVDLGNANTEVYDNDFDSNGIAISVNFDGPYDIHHNRIRGHGVVGGIQSLFPLLGPTRIHHNVLLMEETGGIGFTNVGDSLWIENNLIVYGHSRALFTYCNCAAAIIRNNTVVRRWTLPGYDPGMAGFTAESGRPVTVSNNLFLGQGGVITVTRGDRLDFTYNVLWGLGSDSMGRDALDFPASPIGDTVGNRFVFPLVAFTDMAVTTDSLFRLEAGSPLIDGGDPSLTDRDHTRSDIGWTGGPEGQTYEYPQLPPGPPDSVTLALVGDVVMVAWRANPEGDLSGYRIYRGRCRGFWREHLIPRASVGQPIFEDTLIDDGVGVYYLVTAVDTAGLESAPSTEAALLLPGAEDIVCPAPVPGDFGIRRVYPNPFNDGVTIEFGRGQESADSEAAVSLEVFNILGQRVRTLAAPKGETESRVRWDGRTGGGAPAASGVYFLRLQAGSLADVRRVVLIR